MFKNYNKLNVFIHYTVMYNVQFNGKVFLDKCSVSDFSLTLFTISADNKAFRMLPECRSGGEFKL